MTKIFLLIIAFYQKCISPFFGPRCRYSPTCSRYAAEALKTHGFFLGGLMAFFRILRCNPLNKGGYDPVPPKNFYKSGLW